MSLFSAVEMAPRDPILGLNEAFNADPRTDKVNLGVGVYCNEEGRIPLLRAVIEAEPACRPARLARLPADRRHRRLRPGRAKAAVRRRVATAGRWPRGHRAGRRRHRRTENRCRLPQATAAERRGAISDPSWENHRALFETAGFPVQNYRYYDAATHDVNRAGMLEDLNALPSGSIVVLHACCHNPTGVDLSRTTGKTCWKWSRPRATCRSSTWPTRALATASPKTPPPCACSPNRA
jgi:aromatic-amino-acid transaminase